MGFTCTDASSKNPDHPMQFSGIGWVKGVRHGRRTDAMVSGGSGYDLTSVLWPRI